ncbi:FecR domain-containing protein [Pedobacter sp. ASV1-7]|uniref:FecR family protein n=1 Tax=Pedobacter sp. ASV1-7 TaxID=3145237 RepID=UPI0032E8B1A7
MNKDRIIYLHGRYIENALSTAEQLEWTAILEDEVQRDFVKELMEGTWHGMKAEEDLELRGNRSEEIYAQVIATPREELKLRRLWPRIAAAAAVVLVLGAGLFYYNQKEGIKPGSEIAVVQDVDPGGNRAFLTLADGRRIALTDAASGQLAKQGGITVSKTADGELVYEVKGNDHAAVEDVSLSNTVETPRGGQYQVKLPDGTRVWLNAASKLVYPVNFKSLSKREVVLTGEGYFEVARDKSRPFVVHAAGQAVQVLGTHFNISAYTDEDVVKTTLLEGSVRVSALAGGKLEKVLVPGEQSALKGDRLKVAEVDVQEAVAWKNGVFIFEGETVGSIMRKLSRWYDVEVVYEDNLADKTFSGSMGRYEKISQALHMIEMTDLVHFKIEGRRVIVRK